MEEMISLRSARRWEARKCASLAKGLQDEAGTSGSGQSCRLPHSRVLPRGLGRARLTPPLQEVTVRLQRCPSKKELGMWRRPVAFVLDVARRGLTVIMTGDDHPSFRLSLAAALLHLWVGTESLEGKRDGQIKINVCTPANEHHIADEGKFLGQHSTGSVSSCRHPAWGIPHQDDGAGFAERGQVGCTCKRCGDASTGWR